MKGTWQYVVAYAMLIASCFIVCNIDGRKK